jgi:hypothetical protein
MAKYISPIAAVTQISILVRLRFSSFQERRVPTEKRSFSYRKWLSEKADAF